MARDNEQVCMLAFNLFSFVCIIYSCYAIYEMQYKYYHLNFEWQQSCLPYVAWKCTFLGHIVFFFLCIAFSVGTAQNYLDEDSREAR